MNDTGNNTLTIVLASGNQKKALEMRSLLPEEFAVLTTDDVDVTMPEETGATFEENAILKASSVASQTGLLSIADDSGLEVDALNGKPGVRSARFAADHGRAGNDNENNALLLEQLEHVPDSNRSGRFVAAVAIVTPDGDVDVCRGTVEGRIGREATGKHGFGYDPLFIPDGYTCTMAELEPHEKNLISHRGRAFRLAVEIIKQKFQGELRRHSPAR